LRFIRVPNSERRWKVHRLVMDEALAGVTEFHLGVAGVGDMDLISGPRLTQRGV